jgi:crotonobetainyl-CoA:carnitine CoA-transferase CaiB-like acyl-CoA transferase
MHAKLYAEMPVYEEPSIVMTANTDRDEDADVTATDAASAPLSGVRVVDLTIWMAGSVVKVESGNGDPTRLHVAPTAGASAPPESGSLSFTACNRNKRSIALDLKRGSDVDIMHSLLARADVFVTNLAGPTLRKLGLDSDVVTARYPKLIYARSAGLGTVGPRWPRT